jgi:integrin alpha FG-GAP repeat containing protein 1
VRWIVQLCLAALVLGPVASNALFGAPKKRFKGESLLDIGSLGLSKLGGIVAAVGDVDGSQILDLFVLSSDQRTVSVWLWDSGQSHSSIMLSSFLNVSDTASYTFVPAQSPPIPAPDGVVITNVVPGDYNYDGRLDLLLMGQRNPDSPSDEELVMSVWLGQGNGAFSRSLTRYSSSLPTDRIATAGPLPVPSATLSQPLAFDANGDMKVDLLGYPYIKGERSPTLRLWKNVYDASVPDNSVFELSVFRSPTKPAAL